MDNELEIPKKITELSELLTPSSGQKTRMENLIFSEKLDANFSKKTNILNTSLMNMFKSNKIWLGPGGLALTTFFIVPLIAYQLSPALNSMAPISPELRLAKDPGYANNFSATKDKVDSFNKNSGNSKPDGFSGLEVANYEENKIAAPRAASGIDFLAQQDREVDDEDTTTPYSERAQKRDANLSVKVEDFNKSYTELTNKVAGVGGYLLSVNTNVSDTYGYSNIQVRLPVEKFDEFVNYVRGMGIVTSESINIADKQSQLTEVTKKISTAKSRIEELEKKQILTPAEQVELKNLKNNLEIDQRSEKEIRTETEFSTVWVYITTNQDSSDWSVGGTWSQVVDALMYVFKFWVSAGMWALVPIVCLSPFVLVAIVVRFAYKNKKAKVQETK